MADPTDGVTALAVLHDTPEDKERVQAWLRECVDDFARWPGPLRQFIMEDAIYGVVGQFHVYREGVGETAYWPEWLVAWVKEIAIEWRRQDKDHRAIKDVPS